MTNLKLFSDSTCDLSKEELEQMDIGIIPLIINFKEKSYRDMTEINSQKLFELVEETDEIPSTSALSPSVFAEAFSEYTEKGIPVLSINLASCFSSTYSNAHMGGQSCKGAPVTVIDSNMTCGLLGGILRICHEMKLNDRPCEEIIAKARELTENYRLYFTINDLTFLKKGGRITPAAAAIGTLLKIKPILQIQGGKLDAFSKARTKKAAKKIMIDAIKKDMVERFGSKEDASGIYMQMAYTGDEKEINAFKEEVLEIFPNMEIECDHLSLSVSCHIGKGAIAIACTKKLDILNI